MADAGELVECPDCRGSGEQWTGVHSLDWDEPVYGETRPAICPTCGGSGEISDPDVVDAS
jgi:DnaJ-class molecular chaperone